MTFLRKTSTKKLKVAVVLNIIIICFLAIGSFLTARADIVTGLTNYWKFDEGSSNIAYDSTVNNNDGLITNPIWTTQGKFSNALTFDGTTTKITFGVNMDFSDSFTLSFWINTTGTSYLDILDKQSASTGIYMRMQTDGKILVRVYNSGTFDYTSTVSINDYQWHQVIFIWNKEVNKNYFYIDGYPSGDNSITGRTDFSNAGNFYVGRSYGTNYFNGTLDDFRYYTRALSNDEASELFLYNPNYVAPTPTPEPISLAVSASTQNGIIVLALFILVSLYFSARPMAIINLAIGILTLGVSAGLALGGYLGGLWFFTFAGVALGLICLLRGTDLL